MERLTEKQSSGFDLKSMDGEWCNKYCEKQRVQTCNKCGIYQAIQKLAEYEDLEEIFREKMTDTACEFLKDKEEFGKWLDRNKWITKKCDEWVRAEEQGLLLRLPCKVGDTVYVLRENIVTEEQVYDVQYRGITYQKGQRWYVNIGGLAYFEIDFGEEVFLTEAEANQKLKEMESD